MADELRVDSGALIFATLADVYLSSGMIEEAISILKDGLARNPNYHLAKIILARAYCLKGDCDKAIETIEPIYDEVKSDESANLCLGHCYFKLGDNEKAKKYYEEALKINAENADAIKALEQLVPKPVLEPETAATEVELPDEPRREEVLQIDEISVVPPAAAPVMEEPEPGEETPEAVIQELPEKTAEVESVPLEALDKPAKRLLDLDTVKNVVISTRDGLLIKHYGKAEDDIESICASVAAICLDVDESFRMLKRGGLTRCIIEKSDETLCVMVVGDSLLTVTTKVETKPGLVFIYARKIIEEIEEILG
ncbi:MAG: tetratricopeptide repeat protein [candidate division WOR-3 bacterium]|nr:MAG: tetratricopeptide repeat protein [candidate division WOR-3 bacterium]